MSSTNKIVKSLLLLLCLFSVESAWAQAGKKKALFIMVDGIAADVLEKHPTPNMDRIAAVGGYARAYVGGEKDGYSQTPTISAVGYNSMLTGTWVNKHNVWGNAIKAPNYHYWTIFRHLKAQYPEKKIGVFSSWLDNRTKLVGDGLPETGSIKVDYAFDGFELDTVTFPHDKESEYMHRIDEHVANGAAAGIREHAPDLSWVYLQYPDDMGHRYGDSDQLHRAVTYADNQVGRIWEAIEYRQRQHQEEWLIVITTDHGRDSETGKHHGGQTERERTTWIVTNARDLNSYFAQKPGIVDIMPSVARFMDISLPREVQMEIDGVPFTGNISLAQPTAVYQNNSLILGWKAQQKKGKVKVWLASTNHFKEGGQDEYKLVKTVPLKGEKAVIPVGGSTSGGMYKIVLEGPHNMVNRWVLLP
ncbi:type I phosphodiesterase/nucleotide pyrophosphatase [Pontibacter mucosus]|uniref:Type I phosphodiesterase/nucleotide pyrophosphatase n=1 Tax=Pontibacter mucosus TaxID=1649266 RepID=A0A2T5Y564_9BACT|nr:alkaline phosphatase family protein [Pontibacter mucosus]PTX11428.1 type I phosphodiesterase/nucleotide pyrophosphatase [Pontibacter mucosus]